LAGDVVLGPAAGSRAEDGKPSGRFWID